MNGELREEINKMVNWLSSQSVSQEEIIEAIRGLVQPHGFDVVGAGKLSEIEIVQRRGK